MQWLTKSRANLLPLSVELDHFEWARQEWRYTGETYDLKAPIGRCELCDHPEIRYQFKIVNLLNGKELRVGSECVKMFPAVVLGQVLNRDDSRRLVSTDKRHLVSGARKRRLINTLVVLAQVEERFDIGSFITYVQDRGGFTPKQLSTLFWRLDYHRIAYSPPDFKMVIRKNIEQDQLCKMDDWMIAKLLPAMSKSQRDWVRKNTNYAP
jgi:hypothetical protein